MERLVGPRTLDNFLAKMVDEGTLIRGAHLKTFLELRKAGDRNIGYASSFDQHRARYHPQIAIPVGERMAAWALATQYGKQIRRLPPPLVEVRQGDGRLVLKLDGGTIAFHDGPILGFAIAGKDGRFHPAQARWLDRNEGRGQPRWDNSAWALLEPHGGGSAAGQTSR